MLKEYIEKLIVEIINKKLLEMDYITEKLNDIESRVDDIESHETEQVTDLVYRVDSLEGDRADDLSDLQEKYDALVERIKELEKKNKE